jgi:MFS family permease
MESTRDPADVKGEVRGVSRYRVLLSRPGVRRLLFSSVLARLPLGMNSLAILLFVRVHTDSFLTAGLAVGAFTAASAVLAPVQGRLLDRFGQRRVLLPCAVGEAGLLLLLIAMGQAGAPAGVIVALAGLAGTLLPPVSACVRALWPVVAPDMVTREAAYALDATTQEIIWTVGPMIVALAVDLVSVNAALATCAVVTLFGTLLFAGAPLAREWQGAGPRSIPGGALSSAGLRALLLTVVLTGMVIGALEVGLPALAAQLGSASSAGLLLAVWSFGSMCGGVLYGARSWGRSMSVRHERLLLGLVVLLAPLLLARSLGAAIALSALAGLGLAPMFSCQYTLVGALAPRGSIAEAFNWQVAALVAGVALGSALSGGLIDAVGVRGSFALGSLCALAAYVVAVLDRERIEPLAVAK